MILRKTYFDILKEINNKYILLLIWPRQVGKTTILKQIQSKLKKKEKETFFLNLENPEIKTSLDEHPNNIFDIIWPLNRNNKKTVFIDEIQYLKNPSNFLKFLFDEYNEQLKIIVSWSSSFYIDQKFKDSLIWRKKVFTMYSLDFFEFLEFKWHSKLKIQLQTDKKILLPSKKTVELLFEEYTTYWWYPEIVLINDEQQKIKRLKEYSFDYIKKNIYDAKIQDEHKFLSLLKILANQE